MSWALQDVKLANEEIRRQLKELLEKVAKYILLCLVP